MTVVVGILCQDGVVIGSDSAATFAAGQIHTIQQPTDKVAVIGEEVVLAGTGEVGLGQRFENILQSVHTAGHFAKRDRFEITQIIARNAVDNFNTTAAQPGLYGALLGFKCIDGFQLCEFAVKDFQPEFKTPKNCFVSMGSGQLNADPLLGMFGRVFFGSDLPSVVEGIFVATWTLRLAIELAPLGVRGPIQMATLTSKSDGSPKAQRISENDLQEHEDNAKQAEEYLARYPQVLSSSSGEDIPDLEE